MMNQKKEKTRLFSLVGACVVSASVLVFMACNEDVVQSPETSTSLESKIIEVPAQQSFVGQELADEVFDIVEEQPAPVGGMKEFYSYVAHNLRYPTTARQKGIEGRVFIQFVVDSEGNLTKIKTVKGVGAGCDEEAVRVLEGAPNWKPGKQRGRAVNVRMILPITFKIDKPDENTENFNSKGLGKIKAPQMNEIVVVGFQGK
jgi:TonB family protein